MSFCVKCGNQLMDGAAVCPACGAEQPAYAMQGGATQPAQTAPVSPANPYGYEQAAPAPQKKGKAKEKKKRGIGIGAIIAALGAIVYTVSVIFPAADVPMEEDLADLVEAFGGAASTSVRMINVEYLGWITMIVGAVIALIAIIAIFIKGFRVPLLVFSILGSLWAVLIAYSIIYAINENRQYVEALGYSYRYNVGFYFLLAGAGFCFLGALINMFRKR